MNVRRTRARLTIRYRLTDDVSVRAQAESIARIYPDAAVTVVGSHGEREPLSWCVATAAPEIDICTAVPDGMGPCDEQLEARYAGVAS